MAPGTRKKTHRRLALAGRPKAHRLLQGLPQGQARQPALRRLRVLPTAGSLGSKRGCLGSVAKRLHPVAGIRARGRRVGLQCGLPGSRTPGHRAVQPHHEQDQGAGNLSTGATGQVYGFFRKLSKNLSVKSTSVNVPASAFASLSASFGTGFPAVS